MFDVSTFLLRWIFLSNLTRDIADLQAIPRQLQPQPQHHLCAEDAWRDYCFSGILQYPSGMQRTFTLDALRLELVQQLEVKMMADDATIRLHQKRQQIDTTLTDDNDDELGVEPDRIPSAPVDDDDNSILPSPQQVHEARKSHQLVREYLPQLVSAILQSPSTLSPEAFPAISHLRTVILNRCRDDPAFGIELCWLLEAQVGRTWKTLFEQFSRKKRLIVVTLMPAEKAVVLAKIGRDKREAFDFLQDAEQATAYGDLPSSLSERRCTHFGDTMHWMDRLSKLSSDLRTVPESLRARVLQEELSELNRRIRRRMVTRGSVSLDVEDHLGSGDWPRIDDMSLDVIDHSIHLPLVPQTGMWPDGHSSGETTAPSNQVARILNIVVPESRILSSRERCPFLVHVEVADSGLEANDARLYTVGATGLGATMEEALGTPEAAAQLGGDSMFIPGASDTVSRYTVPRELVEENPAPAQRKIPVPARAFLPRGGSQSEPSYFYNYDPNEVPAQPQHYEPFHHHQVLQQQEQHPVITKEQLETKKVSVGRELLDQIFGCEWAEKCRNIREASPYGHVKGWRLASFIMKAGEDIRQESFVMQIITKLQGWFATEIPEHYRPFMRPYTIMCVGADSGLLECLSDAKSVDEIKKETEDFVSLRDYFERAYGPPRKPRYRPPLTSRGQPQQLPLSYRTNVQDSELDPPSERSIISFEEAQDNFLRSLVGYSLVCYILQVKDRHNANILMDRLGHIMHIDFGYVLGDTPKMGKVPIFSERAPFKLSTEFWEVLGGWKKGGLGAKFCRMFELAFASAARHVDEIASLTEASLLSMDSSPRNARAVADGVRSRLRMRGPPGSKEQQLFVVELVDAALTSWGTNTYDWLQRNMNGYL